MYWYFTAHFLHKVCVGDTQLHGLTEEISIAIYRLVLALLPLSFSVLAETTEPY